MNSNSGLQKVRMILFGFLMLFNINYIYLFNYLFISS